MKGLSRRLAEFSLNLRYEDIPSEAVEKAKRLLLDSVGCALSATDREDIKAAHRYVQALGGSSQSTIIGYGTKTNMPNATLMNSLLIRAMDYNDIYWENDPSHPSDLIPAVLSTGEFKGCSGKDILTGIVLAYELEMRMCRAATPGIREVGWHHASLTQFVSPLVAGKMLGLDEEQMVAAVGISGSSHFTMGGVVAGKLTNMKNAADPMAVEAGVRAALLAGYGYTGPEEVFEGKEGLFEVLSSVKWNEGVLSNGLGKDFMIMDCSYKAFPTEALTHQPITAAIELVKEFDIKPYDVKEVVVKTTTRGVDILSDPSKYDPKTKETADHSLPYCIAVAVARGNVLPTDFEPQALRDPIVRELMNKVKVLADPEIDSLFPKIKRAVVSIETFDGKRYEKKEDYAKGQPELPLSDEELISKFKANAFRKKSSEEQDEIIKATFEIERLEDIREYMRLL